MPSVTRQRRGKRQREPRREDDQDENLADNNNIDENSYINPVIVTDKGLKAAITSVSMRTTRSRTTTTNVENRTTNNNNHSDVHSCTSSTSSASSSRSSSSSTSAVAHQLASSSITSTSSKQQQEPEQTTSGSRERRRSLRGSISILQELAKEIVINQKNIVFITGAGLSVASGIRPFRGPTGVWTHHIWTNSTREAFRRNPLQWYNDFWLQCLCLPRGVKPNAGHVALSILLERFPFNLRMITQNVDGLHPPASHTIEAHGRLGLFKCMPEYDSDTDSESDDDDDRLVHLGHRRKWGQRRQQQQQQQNYHGTRYQKCPYQQEKSLSVDQIESLVLREALREGKGPILETPKCPICNNTLAPQALLFDEGYHSHDFYEFQKMEKWLADAEIIVFVGTSFAVRLPEVTLEHARSTGIPVYNFNVYDMLIPSEVLNANNIRGAAEVTLPQLLQEVEDLQMKLDHPEPVILSKAGNVYSMENDRPRRLRRSSRRKRPLCPS